MEVTLAVTFSCCKGICDGSSQPHLAFRSTIQRFKKELVVTEDGV